MSFLPAIFALLVSAAGWFYLFYSRSTTHLKDVEGQAINETRQRLRRVGGLMMFLLGILVYAGFYSTDPDHPGTLFLLIWLGVAALMMTIVVLALIDLRLTARMKKRSNDLPQ